MQNADFFRKMSGAWSGQNVLHDPMTNTEKTSPTVFSNVSILKETFIELNYDWRYEGEIQEGKLTIGWNEGSGDFFATWIDTWHMSADFMLLKGRRRDDQLDLHGEYEVEGYPNWGWKIVVKVDKKTMKLTMVNISPDKNEYPAVDILLTRE